MLTNKEKKDFFLLVGINAIVCIVDVISLALIVLIIGFYTQNNAQYLQWLPKILLDRGSLMLILLFFIFFTLKNIAGYYVFNAQFKYVYNVAARRSSDNLSAYLNGSFYDYVNLSSASQVRIINDYPIQFSHYVLFGIYQIITESLLIILTITGILLFNAKLFFILLILLLPPVLIVVYITKKKLKHARAHVKETSEITLQYLQEALHGYVESNIYNKRQFFLSRFSTKQKMFNKYLSDMHTSQGLPPRLIEIFAVLGLLILLVISNIWSKTTAEVINIGAFIVAAYKLIPGIVKISNTMAIVKTYTYTFTDPAIQATAIERINAPQIETISLKNIYYKYNDNTILSNFNLKMQKGDFVGMSGNSGKGKTTIINLLLGFLEPDAGDVLINNKVLDNTQRKAYWDNISYVKQQTFLIHDSILKNIVLDDIVQDSVNLNTVINVAGLQPLINKYPEGVNKIIADDGKDISGGQRQRIAIARALYRNAGVIILDEPFNELDNASEKVLLEYLRQLAQQGKIILLITHNTTNLSYCNKVIDLKEQ